MAFHTGGFLESIDPAASFANLAALTDDRLFTSGDDLRVPDLNQVIAIAGGIPSVVACRLRLDSPTLDSLVRYDVEPVNTISDADVEPGSPQAVVDLRDNPMRLSVDEILHCQTNSNPGSAVAQWCLLWFSDGVVNPVTNQRIFTARATGSTTCVADVWNSVNLTLDETLPPGTYQIVGGRFQSATCIAGRYILRTGSQNRPGALGCDAMGSWNHPMWRGGQLGLWGEFPFTQLPAAEFLTLGTDSAQIVHMDLIRTGS